MSISRIVFPYDIEILINPDSPELIGNKTEMSLTLVNKFEVPEQEDASVKALFVR